MIEIVYLNAYVRPFERCKVQPKARSHLIEADFPIHFPLKMTIVGRSTANSNIEAISIAA